jgi:glucose dehydrogenase
MKRVTRLPFLVAIPVALAAVIFVGLRQRAELNATRPSASQQLGAGAEWRNINGDATGARYSTLTQINADNFKDLKVAWEWNGAADAGIEIGGAINARSLPIYVRGKLITTTGPRRSVIAMDPATGKTVWTYQEPVTYRMEHSPRNNHGKGVAYAEVDGRGVIFTVSPARFLTALDVETGKPLPNWGRKVNLPNFPASGVVDALEDQARDWEPYTSLKKPVWDANQGIPRELGYATNSSPPIVANGVIVVGTSHEQGYHQTRIENIPGDIVAYDAKTGNLKWKFHVVPRAGEFGNETWEKDSWKWSGNVGSWAPMTADAERNTVYIPTKGGVLDFYGGFRPGNNLFGNSVLALDLTTGKRKWHYQLVRHDIWNYDTPVAPVLMDVTVNGRRIPGVFQASKQAFLYAFNRETGEPIWPIVDRPVPQSKVPGEKLPATQPHPTKPAPFDLQGRTEDHLIDYTPEIKAKALAAARAGNHLNPFFNPPTHRGNAENAPPARICPGDVGGVNITGPAAADPVAGVIFITSLSGCGTVQLVPGTELDDSAHADGKTIVAWGRGAGGGGGGRGAAPTSIEGVPIFKGPVGRISAIDLNTGEYLWVIPNGDAPQAQQDAIKNSPLLAGVANPMTNLGRQTHSAMLVTPNLLFATGTTADNRPHLFGIDKKTGRRVAQVATPSLGTYGIMTFMHNGKQYVVLPRNGGYTALALP